MLNIFDITIYLIFLLICLIGLISFSLLTRVVKYYFNRNVIKIYEKEFNKNFKYLNQGSNTIIRIIFYNSKNNLIIDMKEFEFIEQDWFLSLLLKYNKDDEMKLDENGYIIYKTDEDYDLFKSLIKTVQYNKLILYNTVNLDMLYHLGEKLCIPENTLDIIKTNKNIDNEMQNLNKLFTKKELIYLRQTFKCKLCRQGFTHLNNKDKSCKYHISLYNINGGFYSCCGKSIDEEPCKIGKHVPEITTNEIELIKTLLNHIN